MSPEPPANFNIERDIPRLKGAMSRYPTGFWSRRRVRVLPSVCLRRQTEGFAK
jgi:hypothetical protein